MTPHSSISISNNIQLQAAATGGTGTLTDPFIISCYNITNNNIDLIDIAGTNKPVIFENCYFNNEGNCSNFGINLYTETNLTIQNNYFENMGTDIYSSNSIGVTIHNNTLIAPVITYTFDIESDTYDMIDSNTFIGGNNGMYMSLGINNSIINNNFNQTFDPIYVVGSNFINISNNMFSNSNQYGIYVLKGNTYFISNNTFVNINYIGIYISGAWYNTIAGNIMTGNLVQEFYGIYLSDSYYNNILGNDIENAHSLLMVDHSNWNIITDNQFGDSINGNGTTIFDSSFNTISYSTFDGQSEFSLVLFNGTINSVIGNNFTKSTYYDLALDLENNSVVEENNFLNLGQSGVSQALDNGVNNLFLYNYYNGWTEPDMNGDGIVDNPYLIAGPAHTFDIKPLTTVNGMMNIFNLSNTTSFHVTVTTTVTGTSNSTSSTNKSSPGFEALL